MGGGYMNQVVRKVQTRYYKGVVRRQRTGGLVGEEGRYSQDIVGWLNGEGF